MWIFGISVWTYILLLATVAMLAGSISSPRIRKIWVAIFRERGKVTYIIRAEGEQVELVSVYKDDARELDFMLSHQIIEGFGRGRQHPAS